MPTCSVPYCPNTSGKDSRLTFHEFPHETPLFLNKWLENIGRPNWRPGVRSVICSDHFQKDDFDRQGRLRIGSFPSKFPEPPFRKKKKLESHHDTSVISTTRTVKPGGVGKSLLSNQKDTVNTQEDPMLNRDVRVNVTRLLVPGKASSSHGTSPVTFTKENVSNENTAGVIDQKDMPLMSEFVACVPSKSPQGAEGAKKRKVLEESQPSSLNADKIASVASSYSLLACRVCGVTNTAHVEIFGPEGWKQNLPTLIRKCLPIKISRSDPLPHHICHQCILRLKGCYELLETCEKTNNNFIGNDASMPSLQKEVDPLIIHSKSVNPRTSSAGNRRVLLLEMSLKEGIPVKNMIIQAVQELNLRLKPKEVRESNPEGRIMFLDLQGGTEAFPEQMKKAISMLFPSPASHVVEEEKKQVSPKKDQTTAVTTTPTIKTKFLLKPSGVAESSSCVRPQATVGISQTTAPNSQSAHRTYGKPAKSTSAVVPIMKSKGSTSVTSKTAPAAPQVKSLATNQNLVLRTPDKSVPVAFLPKPSGASTALQIAKLPSSLPAGAVPKVIHLPPGNIIELEPKSYIDLPSVARSPMDIPDHDYDSPLMEDDPKAESCATKQTIPLPFIPNKASTAFGETTALKGSPIIDIIKMKDKVLTKINNSGNQFKLGDKIIGIVLKNSDSTENIQRKLQATFSNGTPVSDNGKTVPKPKERSILPKGSISIPVSEDASIPPFESTNGVRKLKERPMDVLPSVDDPTSYFSRRNARKLSLSFMWQRTGFLVSSYQKLFTWQMEAVSDGKNGPNPVLTCRVCNFEAKSKGEVETHLQAHPDLQCSICWKYFLTVGKVHEHMSVIHCLPKPSEFPKRRTLITWRLNNIKRRSLKQFQCSRCDRKFKQRDALKRHVNVCKERTLVEKVVAISKGKLFVCSSCDKSYATVEELQTHAAVHTKRTSWLCDVCGLVLKSGSSYRTHIARHDENAHEYQYQCAVCRKRFKLVNRYEEHIKKHDEQQQYICSSCGKVFRTMNGLRQHEILHGERKLQCSFCPSRFHRRDHLRLHEAKHSKNRVRKKYPQRAPVAPGSRMFTCRFCLASKNTAVKFPALSHLLKHYNEVHPNERVWNIPGVKRFECDRCNRSFTNSTLLRHHNMWHAGIHPYTCSQCGAGFMVRERLRNHELTHTNERPFKCQTCGKGFRSRNCLKQHKVIHKDPSEFYKCNFCDKTFCRIDNLKTHTRVHTGEKPWKCLECQRQFRLRSECTKHIQIVHNIPAAEIFDHIETTIDTFVEVKKDDVEFESNSAESVIETAIAGITTVQGMELLIEADDLVESHVI